MDLFYKSMFYKLFYTPKILGGVISNLGGGGLGGLYKLLDGNANRRSQPQAARRLGAAASK